MAALPPQAPALPALPASGETGEPWIIAQEWDGGAFVRVTYATDRLHPITVSVPSAVWLAGGHFGLGKHLTQTVDLG